MRPARPHHWLASLAAALLISAACALPAGAREAQLRRYNTEFYTLFTDVPEPVAREASVRMTAMAKEYAAITRAFSGRVPHGMRFELFSTLEGYHGAGGAVGSAGMFQLRLVNGRPTDGRLMAVLGGEAEAVRRQMWRTVQHEGFHQFSALAIGGQKPPWLEEGLAEVFEQSEFCGDSYVSGLAPPGRIRAVKRMIELDEVAPFDTIMRMGSDEWGRRLDPNLYLQAWSMVYYLMYGENGHWNELFNAFVNRVSRGENWERAWMGTFGDPAGFRGRWAAWWMQLPETHSDQQYLAATLRKLAAFAARADAAGEPVTDFASLRALAERPEPPMVEADWIPPGLLDEAVREVDARLEAHGGHFEIRKIATERGGVRRYGEPQPPLEQVQVTYVDKEGNAFGARYLLRRNRVWQVTLHTEPAPPTAE